MLAVTCTSQSADDPLCGLTVGERPDPAVPDGWVRVTLKTAALNHHDLWSLKGVGLAADRLPMVLGCDGAGVLDDGTEVVVHAVVASPEWSGDETLDPKRTLLSELHDGTLAEQVVGPRPQRAAQAGRAELGGGSLPADRLADRLPDAVHARAAPGPVRPCWCRAPAGEWRPRRSRWPGTPGSRCGRPAATRTSGTKALEIGAHEVFETGARLPGKVDAVIETVGKATWSHSMRALRPGGTLVVSGATTGPDPSADLNRLFFLQLRVDRLDHGHPRGARRPAAASASRPACGR